MKANYGTWIIDWICSSTAIEAWNVWANEVSDPGMCLYLPTNDQEDVNPYTDDKYLQDINEIASKIPLIKLFTDIAFYTFQTASKLKNFWFRPWLTSPFGRYLWELYDWGVRDFKNQRKQPRYPNSEAYMAGWKRNNTELFTDYDWWDRGINDYQDEMPIRHQENEHYMRGWNEAKDWSCKISRE